MDGGDLQSMLQSILAKPEALKEAMTLAENLKDSGLLDSLMSSGRSADVSGSTEKEDEKKDARATMEPEKSGTQMLSLLGLQDGSKEKGERHREDRETGAGTKSSFENNRRLLQALRPYLGDSRKTRIDQILKLLQMMELANKLGLGDVLRGGE